jgi:glycerophosphoryl diester phosphodiesterase
VLSGTWKHAIFPFDALQIPSNFRGIDVISRPFVNAAHHHGIQVHVWTIDDPTEMYQLLAAGVDGIVTDLPDVLLKVLTKQ